MKDGGSPRWLEKLHHANDRIVERLRFAESVWVVRHSAEFLRQCRNQPILARPLSSPVRQIFHLLGLLLATPQDGTRDLSRQEWASILYDLEEIFSQYQFLYYPEPSDFASRERWDAADVSMPVFMEYFNTVPLFFDAQVRDRIRRWFSPFDEFLQGEMGLSTEDCLASVAWLYREASEQGRRVGAGLARAKATCSTEGGQPSGQTFGDFLDAAMELHLFSARNLEEELGAARCTAFLDLLSVRRGGVSDYYYPTERNPALERPLIWIDDHRLGYVDLGIVLRSLLPALERKLRDSGRRQSFFRHRSVDLLRQTADLWQAFLPESGRAWTEVFEGPDGHHEHDLLVEAGSRYLVIEVKSTPPKEPLRDPEKAFRYLKQAFRKDTGIQGAYDQGEALRRLLLEERPITLYGKDGTPKLALPAAKREVRCLCVTADSFGTLASDLTLLLSRNDDTPYPWVVSVTDLETTLDAFAYFDKGFGHLWDFIVQRGTLHGFVSGSDELEFVGAYLRLGSLEPFKEVGKDRIFLSPDYSDIFDELEAYRRGFRDEPPEADTARLQELELPRLSDDHLDYFDELSAAFKAVGRNDPCPCGSGKKYKKCHLLLWRRIDRETGEIRQP